MKNIKALLIAGLSIVTLTAAGCGGNASLNGQSGHSAVGSTQKATAAEGQSKDSQLHIQPVVDKGGVQIIADKKQDPSKNQNSGNDQQNTNEGQSAVKVIDKKDWSASLQQRVSQNQATPGTEEWIDNGKKYIIVRAGQKPNAGYTLQVKEIRKNSNGYTVTVQLQAPQKGQMYAQVITYPTLVLQADPNVRVTVVGL